MQDKIKKLEDLLLIEEPTFEECMEIDRLIEECTIIDPAADDLHCV